MKQFIPDVQFNIIKINVNRKYLLKQRGKEYKCSVSVPNGNNIFLFLQVIRTRPFSWTTFGARDLEPFHYFEVDHNAPCFPPNISHNLRLLSLPSIV